MEYNNEYNQKSDEEESIEKPHPEEKYSLEKEKKYWN